MGWGWVREKVDKGGRGIREEVWWFWFWLRARKLVGGGLVIVINFFRKGYISVQMSGGEGKGIGKVLFWFGFERRYI